MRHAINSPFRYAGGKFKARQLILELILEHQCYIEPFVGGGSIFFAKEKSSKNILNDLDQDLMNTYVFIRDHVQDLIQALDGEEATKDRHTWYKNFFVPKNDLERAQRWYYLNRTSYSGIMNPKNCYFGYGDKFSMRPENWGRSLLRTSEKLQGVELLSLDFEKLIDTAPDGAFLFVDPPYFNADQDKLYTCSFKPEDHQRLASCLERNKHRVSFLLTYDNCSEIREMYQWADEHLDREWNYTISRSDNQSADKSTKKEKNPRNKGRELFILNRNPYL